MGEITMFHYLAIGLFMFLAGLLGSVILKNVIIFMLFYLFV